jgi:hypothetical protein
MKRFRKGDKVVFKLGTDFLATGIVDGYVISQYNDFGLVEIFITRGGKTSRVMVYQREVVLFEDFPEDVFWGSPHGKLLNNAF